MLDLIILSRPEITFKSMSDGIGPEITVLVE